MSASNRGSGPSYDDFASRPRRDSDVCHTSKPTKMLLALVAADIATKYALVTQSWAWHPSSSTTLNALPVAALGVAALFLTSTAACLVLAGAIGNGISASLGDVANPFVLRGGLAFNLADVYLYAGFVVLFAVTA